MYCLVVCRGRVRLQHHCIEDRIEEPFLAREVCVDRPLVYSGRLADGSIVNQLVGLELLSMKIIDRIYIDGKFVTPHGTEYFDLFNPAKSQVIGQARLADQHDTRLAIAAAKRALPAFSRTSKAERMTMLRRLHDAVTRRADALLAAAIEEYGRRVEQRGW